ncbi:MAG: NYN domain-containing protein [Candidatus Absconditabacterales bacterium]
MHTIALIDTQNVHMGIQDCGRTIDWKKFFGFLKDKFLPNRVILFMGYIKKYDAFYDYLRQIGYEISFKNVILGKGLIKGNIDSHLILKAAKAYYEGGYDQFILVSGDGDFDVLVEFLLEKKVFGKLLVPNRYKASKLLKNILPAHDIQDLSALERKLKKTF